MNQRGGNKELWGGLRMIDLKRQIVDGGSICFSISNEAGIDLDALNTLARGSCEGVLPCSYRADAKQHFFTYDARGYMPLDSDRGFAAGGNDDLLPMFIEAAVSCCEFDLPLLNIYLDAASMFVREDRMRLILLPLERKLVQSQNIFFSKAFMTLGLSKEYRKQLMSVVKTSQDEKERLKLLRPGMQEMPDMQKGPDMQAEPDLQAELDLQEGTALLSNETQAESAPSGGESQTQYITQLISQRADSEYGTALLPQPPETQIIAGEHFGYETAMISQPTELCADADDGEVAASGFIIRSKTGERIPILAPIWRIGKPGGHVEYKIKNSPGVSQHHASLVFESGECFIVDNNSTNQTFVEGTAIAPFEKVRLENGALISLGDENLQIFMNVAGD